MIAKTLVCVFLITSLAGFDANAIDTDESEPLQNESTLTLAVAVDHALEYHPDLRKQRLQIEIAALERKSLLQGYLPGVSLQSRYTWLDDPLSLSVPEFNLEVMPGISISPDLPQIQLQDDRFFKASLHVEQVLFSGFRIPSGARALKHKKEALEFFQEAGEAGLITAVAEAWDRVILLNTSLRVIEEATKRLDFEYEKAEKAYETGLIPYYDLSSLRAYRQDLRAKQTDLSGMLDLTLEELSYLTGLDSELFRNTTFSAKHSGLDELIVDETGLQPGEAVKRPEIRALESQVQAHRALTRVEKGRYAPEVFAFYQRELYEDDLSILEPVRAMGIGARWTIFNRGQTARAVQISNRELRAAELELDHVDRGLQVKGQQAVIARRVADEKAETARLYKQEAETGLRLAQRRYELGLSDVGERLAAETDFREASLMAAEATYLQRRAEMDIALSNGRIKTNRTK